MTDIVCWGATGQCLVLREALAAAGHRLVVVADERDLPPPFTGVATVHGEDGFVAWETLSSARPDHAVVAIGGARGIERLARQAWLSSRGYVPFTVVHPRAFVADDAVIGDGCQVLAMSAVCAGVELGQAVIINTRSSVDHGCRLADGVHIGPGATLAGEVIVEANAFIGAGATILPRITIGAGAIVGAGAVVTHDVIPGTVVVGVPAAPLRADR
ncbi:MAG: NeuD/PglB/VioB family sugar acetyltransferase [Luteibacter sp.]